MNKVPNLLPRTINMKTRKQKHSQINHTQTPRNHTGLSTKTPTPRPLTKIIPPHPMHLNLSLNKQLCWNQLYISPPIIRKENLNFQQLEAVKHLF